MAPMNAPAAREEIRNLANKLSSEGNKLTDDQSFHRIAPILDDVTNGITAFKLKYGLSETRGTAAEDQPNVSHR